jgi:hypothetical protein
MIEVANELTRNSEWYDKINTPRPSASRVLAEVADAIFKVLDAEAKPADDRTRHLAEVEEERDKLKSQLAQAEYAGNQLRDIVVKQSQALRAIRAALQDAGL